MKETIRNVLVDYIKYKRYSAELRAKNEKLDRFFHNINSEDLLAIAVYPTGGLGDYIISSKLIDEIQTYGPCKIDVFCENIEFGNAIYKNREGMQVMPASMYDEYQSLYDLSLTIEHFVHVNCYNAKKLMDLAPQLFKIIETIRTKWNELYLPIDQQCYRERLHFEQMKLQGLNRYTELSMGGLFKINDTKTFIPLNDEYRDVLASLKGKKYITFNYGADSMHTNKMQLKVWPMEYYERLIYMIHEAYPNIIVAQLGGKKARKAKNADVFFLGESLEAVKWILKESECHIDCEGGLVHLATQLGTHCIVIFGPTPLHMYGYPQNTNIVNEKCNNCMGIYPKWAFECYKGEEQPECMYGVTAERVFGELDEFINGGTREK